MPLLLIANASASTPPTPLPDFVEWSETGRAQGADGGVITWAPNGTVGVEASGIEFNLEFDGRVGSFPAIVPRAVDSSLNPLVEVYPVPAIFRSAEFSPNGSIFLATFVVPPSQPYNSTGLEFANMTLHIVTWDATTWSILEDRVLGTNGDVARSSPAIPMQFRFGPAGDILAMWDVSGLGWPAGERVELRAFPGFAEIRNVTLSNDVRAVAWSPSGTRIAVATGMRADESGEVAVLRVSDLTPLASLQKPNSLFQGLSWSPDEQQVAAKSVSMAYHPSGCPAQWAAQNLSLIALDPSSLAITEVIWFSNSSGSACDMDFYSPEWWPNASSGAVFHPRLPYLLVFRGGNVTVLNTTSDTVVFSANLTVPSTEHAPIGYPAWLGKTLSFFFANFGYQTPSPPDGWPIQVVTDRAVYVVSPHTPSVEATLSDPQGDVHLFPAYTHNTSTLRLSFDSAQYTYREVFLNLSGGANLVSFAFTPSNGSIRQVGGSSLVLLLGAAPQMQSAFPVFSFSLELFPSWNISYSGRWNVSATSLLADGSSAQGNVTGELWTHLEALLDGPLLVTDVDRGLLSSGGYENATPTLHLTWGSAHFFGSTLPLIGDVFIARLSGGAGAPLDFQTLPGAGGDFQGALALPSPGGTLRVSLSNGKGTLVDRTSLELAFLVDDSPPVLTIDAPSSGSWVNGLTVEVRFRAVDTGSGPIPSGALASAAMAGQTPFASVPAWADTVNSSASILSLRSLLDLPAGARQSLSITVYAWDAVGHRASAIVTIEADREGPAIAVGTIPGWVNHSSIVLSWVCSDAGVGLDGRAQKAYYRVSESSPPTAIITTPGPSTPQAPSFEAVVLLGEGMANEVQLVCEDALGNANMSEWLRISVDLSPPTLALYEPTSIEIMVGVDHVFRVVLADVLSGIPVTGLQFSLSQDGGTSYGSPGRPPVLLLPNGSFEASLALTLAEGRANRVLVLATDRAGNAATFGPFSLRVNVPPSATITLPAADYTGPAGTMSFSAIAQDEDGDALDIEWFLVDSGAPLGTGENINATLPPGDHLVELRVSDGAGHQIVRQVRIVLLQVSQTGGFDAGVMGLVVAIALVPVAILFLRARFRRKAD